MSLVQIKITPVVTLTGIGNIVALASPTSTLIGTGSLNASVIEDIIVSMSGTGTISATPVTVFAGLSSLSGTGNLIAAVGQTAYSTVSGSSTVIAVTSQTQTQAATLTDLGNVVPAFTEGSFSTLTGSSNITASLLLMSLVLACCLVQAH